MAFSDRILLSLAALGMFVMIGGVVYANIAVQRMRGVLNLSRAASEQLKWHDAIQKVAQDVIDQYKAAEPNGILNRQLRAGYYVSAGGGILTIGCMFAFQFSR
jgi:hypothetical protein